MKDQDQEKFVQIADGFNFATADDKRRLLEWVACPVRIPSMKIERSLLIVGPKCSGKTTLAMRLMKYFGEEPLMLVPQGNKLWRDDSSQERRFRQAAETRKIVAVDGFSLIRSTELFWMEEHVSGFSYNRRKPRSTTEIEKHTYVAHLVVTALAMAKCVEKKIKNLDSTVVVRLAERGKCAASAAVER